MTNKRHGKGGLIFIAVLMIAVICTVCVGCFFGGKESDANNVQSLREYAEKLEKAGNSEAAAAVYELIPKAINGELLPEAHEETPILKEFEDVEQFHSIMNP